MICLDRKISPLCKLSLVNKIRFGGLSLQRKLNLPVSKIKELVSEVKKLDENITNSSQKVLNKYENLAKEDFCDLAGFVTFNYSKNICKSKCFHVSLTAHCNSACITLCYSGTDTSFVLKHWPAGPPGPKMSNFDPKFVIFWAKGHFLFVYVNSPYHHHNIWGNNFPVGPTPPKNPFPRYG